MGMCAGCVVCCPLVNHVEYEPDTLLILEKICCTLLRLENRQDGLTPDCNITLTTRCVQHYKVLWDL